MEAETERYRKRYEQNKAKLKDMIVSGEVVMNSETTHDDPHYRLVRMMLFDLMRSYGVDPVDYFRHGAKTHWYNFSRFPICDRVIDRRNIWSDYAQKVGISSHGLGRVHDFWSDIYHGLTQLRQTIPSAQGGDLWS